MNIRILLLTGLAFLLTACGGSSGGGAPGIQQGVFLDSAVQGMRFSTNTRDGTTDANGTFSYAPNEVVSFFIGDILLGSAPAKATMTPLDLVPGAADENNPQVTNMLRFLQTIDSDNDATNGIQISNAIVAAAASQTINFNMSIAAFEGDATTQATIDFLTQNLPGGVRPLVSITDAQAHLRDTLAGIGGGGGGGGGNGSFGSLTMSGTDTAVIGTSYVPVNSDFLSSGSVASIGWPAGLGIQLSVSALNGTATSITLIILSPSDPTKVFAYVLDCTITPAACANLSIDLSAQSATFSNQSVPVATSTTNVATAAINLTGILSWQ